VGGWRTFLDSLATTGGHIFILAYLIMYGSVFAFFGEMYGWMAIAKLGESMVSYALGALTMMYKPSGTNAEQIARAGVPYQPPQPPPDALKPPIIVAEAPLPPSTISEEHHE